MSVLDLLSRVVTRYEADADGHISELKKLKGAITDAQKEELKAHEARKSTYGDWLGSLSDVKIALDGVREVVGYVADSVREYGEELRLQAAAGSANLDRMAEAAGGLLTKMQLLTFASQVQHGVLKTTQAQQEELLHLSVLLGRAGFDQAQAVDKLTEALVSGKVDGLDKFGLSVKQGSDNLETLNNIMEASHQKTRELGNLAETEADRIQKMSVSWDNTKRSIADFTAQTVASMAPLAQAEEMLSNIDAHFLHDKYYYTTKDELPGGSGNTISTEALFGAGFDYDQVLNSPAPQTDPWAQPGSAGIDYAALTGTMGRLVRLGKRFHDYGEATKRAAEERARYLEMLKQLANQQAKATTDELIKQLEAEQEQSFQDTGVTGGLGSITPEVNSPELDRAMAKQQELLRQNKNQTLLEQLFGTPDQMSVYKSAITGTLDAAAASLDALIVGSQAGSKSFAQSIGAMVHAQAVKELAMGFAEEGEGIASLFTNPAAAPGHFAAGAKLLAVGAALDVFAKGLGFSGGGSAPKSSGGSASAGGAGGGASASSSTPTTTNYNIIYGSQFGRESLRMRALESEDLVNQALGGAGHEDS